MGAEKIKQSIRKYRRKQQVSFFGGVARTVLTAFLAAILLAAGCYPASAQNIPVLPESGTHAGSASRLDQGKGNVDAASSRPAITGDVTQDMRDSFIKVGLFVILMLRGFGSGRKAIKTSSKNKAAANLSRSTEFRNE